MSSFVCRPMALLVLTLLGPLCVVQAAEPPKAAALDALNDWFQKPENLASFKKDQPGVELSQPTWPDENRIVVNGLVKNPASWSDKDQAAAIAAMKKLGETVKQNQLQQVVSTNAISVEVNLKWDKPNPKTDEPDVAYEPINSQLNNTSGNAPAIAAPVGHHHCSHCQAMSGGYSTTVNTHPIVYGYREPLAPNYHANVIDAPGVPAAPMSSNGPAPVSYSTTGPNPGYFYGSNGAWSYSPNLGSPIWNRFNRGSY